MNDILMIAAMLGGWILLQKYVLPRVGVQT